MDSNDTNNASLSSVFDRHDDNITPSRNIRQLFISVLVLLSFTSLLSSYDFVYPSDSDSATTSMKSTTQEQTIHNDDMLPFEDERPRSSSPPEQNYDNQATSSQKKYGNQVSSSPTLSPPPLNLSIPHKIPLTTVTPATIPPHALGGATLPMFLGTWHPSPSSPSPSIICPVRASRPKNKYQCNYTTSKRQRTVKTYHSPTPLPPFNALRFESELLHRGPLMIVGDSIGGQLANELKCLLEETIGWDRSDSEAILICRASMLVEPPPEVQNVVELTPGWTIGLDDFSYFYNMSWVDEAIDRNASFVVYNTGAWWNHRNYFRERGEWCDWSSWPAISRETMVDIFEKSLRYTLIPELKRLWRDHGIRTVWFDIPVGGEWDESIQDINGSIHTDYYHMFPVFNRIGRQLVVEEAEGWLLPTFDLSLKRWEDHMFDDATYTAYDPLHWCETYDHKSVPAVWANLLQQVLFGDGEDMNDDMDMMEVSALDESNVETSSDEDSRQLTIDESHDDMMMIMPPFPSDELMTINAIETNSRRGLRSFHHVPYSRSNETTCPCSDGKKLYHCVANIGCEWVEVSEGMHVCQDKS